MTIGAFSIDDKYRRFATESMGLGVVAAGRHVALAHRGHPRARAASAIVEPFSGAGATS
jgi:hypothetical protein